METITTMVESAFELPAELLHKINITMMCSPWGQDVGITRVIRPCRREGWLVICDPTRVAFFWNPQTGEWGEVPDTSDTDVDGGIVASLRGHALLHLHDECGCGEEDPADCRCPPLRADEFLLVRKSV